MCRPALLKETVANEERTGRKRPQEEDQSALMSPIILPVPLYLDNEMGVYYAVYNTEAAPVFQLLLLHTRKHTHRRSMMLSL